MTALHGVQAFLVGSFLREVPDLMARAKSMGYHNDASS